jgi:long-chain acyl-CoA synthetase
MYPGKKAQNYLDRPAIIMAGSGEVITYGEYESRSNRLAHCFRAAGLRRLDHVAYFMENNPRLFDCQGAAERTGVYYTLVNSHLPADEAAYIINDCEARVVVTSSAKAAVALELPALCPKVERWIMVDTDVPMGAFESYESVVAPFPTSPIADEQYGQAMPYSSGTTGRPKGIFIPMRTVDPDDPEATQELLRTSWKLREGMVFLSTAPLYHAAPRANLAMAIRLGATSVIMERFSAEGFLDLVERYRVTHTQVVPTMFVRLLKLPEAVRARADLSSLEVVVHAAAPCPIPVKYQMIEWLGPILVEYYSTSEGIGFTLCDSEEWLAHPGTVGRPVVGTPHILDDEGNECPPGVAGNIWFTDTKFEYFGDAAKTAEARDTTGTLATAGDIGYLDDDGYLYLTDRKSYLIISGGVNIYPQEVEHHLIAHPKVLDVAVIGVPNEEYGEEVKAVVELVAGVAPGPELEAELIEFCRAGLAHFKCPRSVDFEAELPRLPTGKLYKRTLRERYWAGHGNRIV